MISLDWKERLIQDSEDFLLRKIPMGDYDFDIIFNAYPERVDNKVPNEVIVLVATTLSQTIAKKPKEYEAFLNYIWSRKGDCGKLAFVCIMRKVMARKNNDYIDYVKDLMLKANDIADANLLLDRALFPVFKKNPIHYTEMLINLIDEKKEEFSLSIVKTIMKLVQNDQALLKSFVNRMESNWLNASAELMKINAYMLKAVAKSDPELYFAVYNNYKNTRDPVFIEILTAGLALYSDELLNCFENWSKSGNARVKKAAITGLRFLNKRRRK
ncbi:MAG: hypothetical protein RBS16_02375 [Candidatus Cloacimonadales bacterium]|jgi:hypothetical protein|nr:hypothetical protein [Candidatus Cloacimonadales bacterium]